MQLTHFRARTAFAVLATTIAAGGAFAAQAGAHARVSPSLTQLGTSQVYTLVVPSESETATISEIEMTVPEGFTVGAFEANPAGVKREVESSGSGEEVTITKVKWTGLKIPAGEAAFLRFSGRTETAANYGFPTVETYSDGEVASWTGAKESDTPTPTVDIVESLGASGGDDEHSETMGTIALIVAALALILGLVGLARRGGRDLT